MTTRKFIEGLADPVQARGTDHRFSEISEIVHALTNCMSILHFWVETLVEVNRDFPAPCFAGPNCQNSGRPESGYFFQISNFCKAVRDSIGDLLARSTKE